MFDERAYVARLEAAGTEELANMLARPTADEEKALRVYLGDERYRRMHGLALRRGVRRSVGGPRGNVVVIPGVMGSELTTVDRRRNPDSIWVRVPRLMAGGLDRLRLGKDGRTGYDPNYDVRATGILKRYYGELQLSLSESWNVRAFWFDWRKDLNLAADELRARISSWFADNAPVHIVAHSTGGLVARTFIKNHPERWEAMRDEHTNGESGGRLIMLGTPNHGSFAAPQAVTGAAGIAKKLALLDGRHNLDELLEILNSFVGTYQMLPSPLRVPGMEPLYDAKTYGDLNIPQSCLDNAFKSHESLQGVVDPERMVYVAGYNQPTFVDVNDFSRLEDLAAYDVTMTGDGIVPHELGLLETSDGKKVETYYVEEEHGNLTTNEKTLSALDELLRTGGTTGLSKSIPTERRGLENETTAEEARKQLVASTAADEKCLQVLMNRNSQRSAEPRADVYVSTDERKMEEILTRDFLGHGAQEERPGGEKVVPFDAASIEIGLVCGEIQDLPYEETRSGSNHPVDAISVGHYINVKPQEAELELDRAISRALSGKTEEPDNGPPEADLLLTQYFERGIIRGRLGQPFFLPDPRAAQGGTGGRVIALAGMGLPGTFGAPELAVLARELCWSLGRMEKRHLATVLIGSGKGNLPTRDAVSSWIRGIKNAITGSLEDEGRRLMRVTFVEKNPYKIEDMEKAILAEKRRLEERDRLKIDYQVLDANELDEKKEEYEKKKEEERRRRRAEGPDGGDDETEDRVPTRITLSLDGETYRFGAITESASVPEREIPLDPSLVMSANDELAAEPDPSMQSERGRFLEKLLLPAELRAQFSTDAPLVMMLDSTIARIHWEMVAQPDLDSSSGTTAVETDGANDAEIPEFDPDRYLGTSRGFTRQLRTTIAPPPEPPPPPRRVMRVLVVADPAEDAHLPGAEEEGVEVADLFERFNSVYEELSYNRVEVVRLFGPYEATRTTVLRHLLLHSYDVLHFAGHCVYDPEHPQNSGWIFSGGKRISASELNRIDRVPKFVFSNACESGITPDRSEMRSAGLAPSFAETFFKRGITNFVCTAWPVDDAAARQFALTLYANLLGLYRADARESRYEPTDPHPMHAAMRSARLAVAESLGGTRTWGAYQHYGSPYFRFFDAAAMRRDQEGP